MYSPTQVKKHYQILIIGGGTAGIMTAAQLLKKDNNLDIGIIEPSEKHYYQAAWTLVGAGAYNFDKTAKPMKDLIPKGAHWIQDFATGFIPEQNTVKTKSEGNISYDFLIVAPGLIMDPSLIKGLTESLGKGVVCSNYTNPKHTWEVLKNFKGGNAIFTQPSTPIKCAGAPQKIAYLTADYLKKNKLLDNSNIILTVPGDVIINIKPIAKTLMKVIERYDIIFMPFYTPIKIDGKNRTITFALTNTGENKNKLLESRNVKKREGIKSIIELSFDMLHIAPPQVTPNFIKNSSLVDEEGWFDVNKHTLQHIKYSNIFGLGDVANLPTIRTASAIAKQTVIIVDNIINQINYNKKGTLSYNGYSACPIITSFNKMVLAEFNYNGDYTPDKALNKYLLFSTSKEQRRLWMLKKYGLPYIYWNIMMKGKQL